MDEAQGMDEATEPEERLPEEEKPVRTVGVLAPDAEGLKRPRGQVILANDGAAVWFPSAPFGGRERDRAFREAFKAIIELGKESGDGSDLSRATEMLERFAAFARAGLAYNYKPETVEEILDDGIVDMRQQEAMQSAFQGETAHPNLRFQEANEPRPT